LPSELLPSVPALAGSKAVSNDDEKTDDKDTGDDDDDDNNDINDESDEYEEYEDDEFISPQSDKTKLPKEKTKTAEGKTRLSNEPELQAQIPPSKQMLKSDDDDDDDDDIDINDDNDENEEDEEDESISPASYEAKLPKEKSQAAGGETQLPKKPEPEGQIPPPKPKPKPESRGKLPNKQPKPPSDWKSKDNSAPLFNRAKRAAVSEDKPSERKLVSFLHNIALLLGVCSLKKTYLGSVFGFRFVSTKKLRFLVRFYKIN